MKYLLYVFPVNRDVRWGSVNGKNVRELSEPDQHFIEGFLQFLDRAVRSGGVFKFGGRCEFILKELGYNLLESEQESARGVRRESFCDSSANGVSEDEVVFGCFELGDDGVEEAPKEGFGGTMPLQIFSDAKDIRSGDLFSPRENQTVCVGLQAISYVDQRSWCGVGL